MYDSDGETDVVRLPADGNCHNMTGPTETLTPDTPEQKNWLADVWKQFTSLLYGLRGRRVRTVLIGLSDWLARQTIGAPVFRFSRVTPQLYVAGQYNQRGWLRLQREGISAVVDMRYEFDDKEAGIAPSQYLYLPVVDNTPPTPEQLKRGVDFITAEIDRGGKVFIHCAAGVGRAPTMAAAYLVSQGLSSHDAWVAIRRVRPFIRPTSGQTIQIEQFKRGDTMPPLPK